MIADHSIRNQIQLLADQHLGFEERALLLREIDTNRPEAWRDVALALVERDILVEATAAAPGCRSRATVSTSWIAAACVALGCFALGWQLRPPVSGVAVEAARPAEPEARAESVIDYPVPSGALVRQANEQLAPTGYEASLLTRYVRTTLDGREIVIPLSQVRLDYRGL